MSYIAVGTGFVILGVYIFVLLRWWYRHLTVLAERYDLIERRRKAARRFVLLGLLVAVPIGGSMVIGFNLHLDVAPAFFLFALVFSIAPGFIWWVRRMPKLSELGYGPQR